MPFACIFVPNFPVAAIFRAEPELRAQAVAIFEGKPPLEKVFAVNENASRVGISPGMTKAQAELCSELTLRPRSSLQESAAHAALLDCAQSFSPCVEEAAADTAILDLAGMESLFGTLPEIARNLFRCATNLGLDGNVAVASNPDAAGLAARAAIALAGEDFEHVAITFRNTQPDETLNAIAAAGARASADRVDFSADAQDVRARLAEIVERWGPFDTLVHGAGPLSIKRFERLTLDDYSELFDGNVRSAVQSAAAVLPQMRATGFGRIVFF